MRLRAAVLFACALLIGLCFHNSAKAQQSADARSRQAQDTKSESVYAEIGKAPEKARGKRNPLEKDPEAVAAGRILFEQHCAECHGDTAEGGKKGPNLHAAEVQGAEAGAIFWILTNGVVRKGMPVWSKLPEPQRWQLVSYVKSLGVTPANKETASPGAQPPAKDSALPRH